MNDDFTTYINALGTMFEQPTIAVRDGQGSPPWSPLFDLMTAPEWALPWVAQFIGVQFDIRSQFETAEAYWARQRQRIVDHLNFQRGTLGAIRSAAQLYLTGNKSVFIQERDGSPYRLTVITRTSETPDPNQVEREILRQKPAGILLTYTIVTGRTYAETTALGRTYSGSATAWPHYTDREGA